MMRYIQAINWVLLAASTVLAVTLGVVCLLFWIYRAEPIMQDSFPELMRQTSMFTGMALLNAAAALTLHFRKPGFWLLQLALATYLAAIVNYYLPS